ncbi:MAG: hypothetical protein ACOY4R_22235 [Pseudomonadota bacterium]
MIDEDLPIGRHYWIRCVNDAQIAKEVVMAVRKSGSAKAKKAPKSKKMPAKVAPKAAKKKVVKKVAKKKVAKKAVKKAAPKAATKRKSASGR